MKNYLRIYINAGVEGAALLRGQTLRRPHLRSSLHILHYVSGRGPGGMAVAQERDPPAGSRFVVGGGDSGVV